MSAAGAVNIRERIAKRIARELKDGDYVDVLANIPFVVRREGSQGGDLRRVATRRSGFSMPNPMRPAS